MFARLGFLQQVFHLFLNLRALVDQIDLREHRATRPLVETSSVAMVRRLVAGGTGFAPVKAIIEYALHSQIERPMVIYWGSQDRAGLYQDALARSWAEQHPHIHYIPVLSQPGPRDAWPGRTGLVHEVVLADFPNLAGYQVYACGAPAMIEAARRDFLAQGLPEDEFLADAFTFSP